MADEGIKTQVSVLGEKEYKKALGDINRRLRVLNTELNVTTSAYDKDDKSVEALSAKSRDLNKIYDKQVEKQKLIAKQLAAAEEEYGANSKQADDLRIALNNATAAVNKTQKAIKTNNEELADAETAMADAGTAAGDLADSEEDLEGDAKKAGKAVKDGGKDAKDSEKEHSKLKTTLENVAKVAGKTLKVAAETAGVALAAMGAAAAEAAKAGFDAAKGAGTYADDLLTLASTTGLTTEELQKYGYASNFVDTSLDTITGSMTKLEKSMGSGSDAFDKLGVSTTNADGSMRDAQDVFWDCIDALGGVANETERDQLAMELMGKGAKELNPLIEAGSEAFKAYGEEASSMGTVFSDENLTKMGSFDDSMQRMNAAATGLGNAIGLTLIPAFQPLVDAAAQSAADISLALQNGATPEELNTMIQGLVDTAMTTFTGLATMIENNMPTIQAALETVLTGLGNALPGLIETLCPLATDLISSISTALLKPETITALTTAATGILSSLGSAIATAAPQLAQAAGEILGGLASALVSFVTSPEFLPTLGTIATGIIDGILSGLGAGFTTADIGTFCTNFWDGLVQGFNDTVETVKTAILAPFNAILGWIKGVFGIASPSTEMESVGGFILEGLGNGLTAGLEAVLGVVTTVFNAIWDAIKAIFGFGGSQENSEGEKTGEDIMKGVKTGVENSQDDLKNAAALAADAVLQEFRDQFTLQTGEDLVTDLVSGLETALAGVDSTRFTAGASVVATAVKDAINESFGISGTGVFGLGEKTSTAMQGVGTAILKAVADGINNDSEGSTSVSTAVETKVTGAIDIAKTSLSGEAGNELGAGWIAGVASGIDADTATESNAGSKAKAAADAAGKALSDSIGKKLGQTFAKGIGTGINNGSATTTAAARSLGEKIKTALSGAVTGANFSNIGLAIDQGIAKGITDNVSIITRAAQEAARKAYDAAKDELGIKSPSRVMAEIGRFYDQGFAKGITSGLKGVESAARGVGDLAARSTARSAGSGRGTVIDYDAIGAAVARANVKAGVGDQTVVLNGRVVGRSIEPDVSAAANVRQSTTLSGRAAAAYGIA